ncbi:MAG: PEP-CTERM sorting domain-containing protein [Limisphaerales bacterium]
MKKQLAIILTLAAVAVSANAQGFFNFANGASGVNAPVKETDGTTLLSGGGAYKADYYWGAAGVSDPTTLVSGGQAVSFSGNGIFLGGTQIISGQTGTVTLQVRAWRASDGATWAAAQVPGAHAGQGNLIQVALGTGAATVPNMVGLQGFNLQVVGPEPATMALALMGAGALFIRRRKA